MSKKVHWTDGDNSTLFTDGEGIMYVSVEPGTGMTTQRDGVEVERGPFAVPQPGAICPTCERIQPPTVQDHECDDRCQEAEHRSIRCILQIVPEPGEECPLCREKTPNARALEMRRYRAKRKEKP